MQESRLQESVVKYIGYKYPKIRYCASLGGIRTSYKQALLAKRTGYIKGFPDLQICIPNKKYCGLFLELKVIGRYATKEQKEWINYLNGAGYKAAIVKGFDNAVELIDSYLNEVDK